ncbi:hypothetical protein sscle_06g050640 [Sclerotinia sclerotiorum 1980 UF-70]|uniref:Uncharacterized protein n=1 Tax=Sclerotinia sclerotiorum (strain ATCC 18683 / 1980 / Ss-1) TaxID=665079 RepID=A0A1D9Q5R8_SCLS1|nr:hypothetical protein sscle_06g050640 [Sclerotinia sclerotiorum 1980 UF-70]
MFDVSWTDPTRETVGQRKHRKDQASTRGSSPSIRSSNSSDSAKSIKHSIFGFFGSGNKKISAPAAVTSPKSPAFRTEQSSKVSRRMSSYTSTSETSTQEVRETTTTTITRIPVNGFFSAVQPYQESERSPSDESIFSGYTGRSAGTKSSWGSMADGQSKNRFIQPLSPNSFVTQSTEITVAPSEDFSASEQLATVVHITSGTVPIQIQDSTIRETALSSTSSTYDFPLPPTHNPETPKIPSSPKMLSSRSDIGARTTEWSITARNRRSDSWRPPETWACPAEETASSVASLKSSGSRRRRKARGRNRSPSNSEQTHLQMNIRKMEAASNKIILERLKEEWMQVADASVYRELELEKQLWMLTALRAINRVAKTRDASRALTGAPQVGKMLSLYENHASASFLSALNPERQIHHISTNPLSPRSYPNIHPLAIPGPTSQLSYASNIFVAIHSLGLPSLLPSSSIPNILKECHRTLISARNPTTEIPVSPASISAVAATQPGILYLTILDPCPVPSSLGPRLRAWLDTHLTVNLEKQFRCLNPTRLFPLWLADAGLWAEGSCTSSLKFLACVGIVNGEEQVEWQLKSVMGRMLWKELWGSYVEGGKWWWDDAGIVEECERMGTCWAGSIIEAVKEG